LALAVADEITASPLAADRKTAEYPQRAAPRRRTRVRFAPKADKSSHRSEMTRWANSVTLQPQ
jgi:hypothetical protein